MSEHPSLGDARKKNGHKANCNCHICENMKKKEQRGGYVEDAKRQQEKRRGLPQKKNGHKSDCTCPICKNMRNAKTKKRGGDGEGKETAATQQDYDDLEKEGTIGGTKRRRRRRHKKSKKQRKTKRRKY